MQGPDATLAFLRQPAAYPEPTRAVTVVETHMSWVFLTDTHAYKLKKPVRHDGLDFSTVERRRLCCEDELRLNRRLAPAVYLGVVPVTREASGALAIGGRGDAVDWLVRMRRLPADAMLDSVIASGRADAERAAIHGAARHLAGFYRGAPPRPPSSGAAWRDQLAAGTRRDREELGRPRYGLPQDTVEALVEAQLRFLGQHPVLFDARAGHIVEGHGDLRPEHICLHPEPAIIDCLEFSGALRVVDPADELAFLGLECERLGDARPGRWFLETYTEVTGDAPPPALLAFYRVYRALRRARLAAWHLDDPSVPDPERFAATARRYLELAERQAEAWHHD